MTKLRSCKPGDVLAQGQIGECRYEVTLQAPETPPSSGVKMPEIRAMVELKVFVPQEKNSYGDLLGDYRDPQKEILGGVLGRLWGDSYPEAFFRFKNRPITGQTVAEAVKKAIEMGIEACTTAEGVADAHRRAKQAYLSGIQSLYDSFPVADTEGKE